ncbi:MAG TPA: hypothetical protein VMA37_03705 [Acetobacteraceae bacterium]|nr:hypothetical protein [Acetobacteraceae bacterium]
MTDHDFGFRCDNKGPVTIFGWAGSSGIMQEIQNRCRVATGTVATGPLPRATARKAGLESRLCDRTIAAAAAGFFLSQLYCVSVIIMDSY